MGFLFLVWNEKNKMNAHPPPPPTPHPPKNPHTKTTQQQQQNQKQEQQTNKQTNNNNNRQGYANNTVSYCTVLGLWDINDDTCLLFSAKY